MHTPTDEISGPHKVFATNLRRAQANAGLTNRLLSIEVETSEAMVSRWRNGHGLPEIDNVLALGRVLGCSVEWFMTDHSEPSKAAA